MMNICRLVCLPPFSALPRHEVSTFPPIQSVANQSGDAKSCVSQAKNAYILMMLLLFPCCDWLRLTSKQCIYIHGIIAVAM